tara:strand:+ start:1258 stop:2535 length:1278 start_codon:yes stop_codon:yes gene_type:complete
MAVTLQIRRGTAAQWTAANTVLAAGEQGYETDTGFIKVGDGTTAWNALAYTIKGSFDDISITTNSPSGNGSLSFTPETATFTFTPADSSNKIEYTDLSIGSNASASGTGGVAYNNSTGEFTYTPPDISAEETLTSLSINANVLTYTDEDGVATQINLSNYLDDTNLARLVSGSLNGSTGIATFTRDDNSTFTVDFSALFDDTDTNDYVDSAAFSGGTLTLGRTGSLADLTVNIDGRYVQTETDPVFTAATVSNIADGTGFLKNNGSGTWTYDNNTYLTEVSGAVTGALIPDANETYDIGSGSFRFKDLYLSGNTIYLGTSTISAGSGGIVELPAGSKIGGSTLSTFSGVFADLTSKPTTVAGYGITDTVDSVNITSVQNGQALIYDSSASEWVNGTNGNDVYIIDGGVANTVYTNGDLVLDGGSA